MLEKIDILIAILLGSLSTVSLLCSLVLFRGGVYVSGQEHSKPTKIQQLFGTAIFISSIISVLYTINEYLVYEPSPTIRRILDSLCMMCYAFAQLQALVLQQIKLRLKHWLIALCPYMPLVVSAFTIADKHFVIYHIVNVFSYFYLIAVIIYSLIKLNRWDKKMLEMYSDVYNKQTVWFRGVALPLMFALLFWIPLIFFPDMKWLLVMYYLIAIFAYVRSTAYALSQEEFVFEEAEIQLTTVNDCEGNVETESKEVDIIAEHRQSCQPAWANNLHDIMVVQRAYSKEDLTCGELASMLNVNRTYLSRYLNDVLHTTFYDYVNGYRLDESEQLLKAGELSVSDIAVRCGFRDRSAFYRIFKRRHSVPPTEWAQRFLKVNGGT